MRTPAALRAVVKPALFEISGWMRFCRPPAYADVDPVVPGQRAAVVTEVGIIRGSGGRRRACRRWACTSRAGPGRSGSVERGLLELHVGVQVDLGRLRALVAEPERNDSGVDTRGQEPHRGGVAQRVRGDVLAHQRRAGDARGPDVLAETHGHGVAAHPASRPRGEQDCHSGGGESGYVLAQDRAGLAVERGDALLAALALAGDVRSMSDVDTANDEPGQLGHAKAGRDGQLEHRVVAPAGAGGAVWRRQQSAHLVRGEVGEVGAMVALRRNGHDLAYRGRVLRVQVCRVGEEGVDRGEAGVAGADAVASNGLQVGQEVAYDLGGQRSKVQTLRASSRPVSDKPEKHLPGVAVGGDRVLAGAELARQPRGEEPLQRRSQCGHEPTTLARAPWPSPCDVVPDGAVGDVQLVVVEEVVHDLVDLEVGVGRQHLVDVCLVGREGARSPSAGCDGC